LIELFKYLQKVRIKIYILNFQVIAKSSISKL